MEAALLGIRFLPMLTRGLLLLGSLIAISAAGAAVAAADEAAWVYNPNTVVEINLGLSPEAIDALEAEPDEYVRGSFELSVGGEPKGPTLGDVGIRLKGGTGSFRPLSEKAAFKIKFNEYSKQTFFGLKKLTLNNMVQDPSMLHETLAYEVFRALDVPASRTGYARVQVNDADYGLYLDIETLDSISLPQWFASTQHLYEADTPGVDVSGSAEEFEVDEGDDEDLADLEALITAANDDEGDWSEGMAATADLDEMTRMWAVERYIGHWDGYAGVAGTFRPNNYYLHSDDIGLFEMMPWGTDQTWGDEVEFDGPAGGLLFNECLADASCHALYDQALEGVQDLVPTLELKSKAERYAELLAPCQALESEPRREYSEEEIADGVEDAIDFFESRPTALSEYLGQPSPPLAPNGTSPPTEEPCSPDPEPESPEPGGGESPADHGGPASNVFSLGALRRQEKRGVATLTVAVPGPGAVGLSGKGLKPQQVTANAAGAVKLTLKATGKAKKSLRKRGRARVRASVTFTPIGGSPASQTKLVQLRKKKQRSK